MEQIDLLDTTCRPLTPAPPGAVPVGPVAPCVDCGALAMPYGFVTDDPLSNSVMVDRDRRDPVCLACTITRARKMPEWSVAPAIRAWALGDGAT